MPEPIVFVIQDGVDPSIAKNVAAIGDAAQKSDAAVQALTQGLQAIQNSGVQGLAGQLSNASTATTRLSNSTSKMAAAALDASQKVDKLVTSYNNLNTAIAANIATLSTLNTALRSATTGAGTFNQGVNQLGRGTGTATGNFIASSAALSTLEGKFGSNTRAAGRFLSTTLGLGPALQAAFPIFGAVALIGVLGVMVAAIDKVVTHAHNLTLQAQQDAITLLNSNKELIKGEHGIGNFFGNKLLAGRDQAPDVTISDPSKVIREVNFQLQINDLLAQRNEFGKQGLELQKAKVKSVQDEITATQNAINTIREERNKIQNPAVFGGQGKVKPGLLDETTIAHKGEYGAGGLSLETVQPKIPVDSEQFKALTGVAKEYDNELDRLNKQLKILQEFKLPAAIAKEPFAAAKDEAKAARLQLKGFTDDLEQLKIHQNVFNGGANTTESLQQQLNLLNSEVAKALPQNLETLHARIATVTGEIERHKQVVDALFQKYQDSKDSIGQYSDQLKIQSDYDKAILELQKNHIILTDQEKNKLKELIAYTVEHERYQSELKKTYEEFNGPLRDYLAKQQAITKLEKDGVITHAQAVQALTAARKQYTDATQPLAEYTHGLQNQVDLLGKYGIALTVATEVQKVQDDLRQKGIVLKDQEIKQLTTFLTQLEKQKELQQAVQQLYNQNIGAVEKITTAVNALNVARKKEIISEEQYRTELAKLKVELANLNIEMNKFSKADVLTSVFGSILKDFKGFTKGVIDLWGQTWNTIVDGAANALGRAIAYGENLGDALKDVARQALSELIAGFVKLGIQLLTSMIIGKTAGSIAASESIVTAGAVGAAWAPAAAFSSLATLGANAGPADLALSSTVAFAELLNAFKFNSGGVVPGYGNRDTVPALLTPGEGILNQAAMRQIGAQTLQAWNRGNFTAPASGRATSASGQPLVQLNLIHDKNAVDVVQENENTIRIIAKQEAQKAVHSDAPDVIAAHISNPNSRISKNLKSYTNVRSKH